MLGMMNPTSRSALPQGHRVHGSGRNARVRSVRSGRSRDSLGVWLEEHWAGARASTSLRFDCACHRRSFRPRTRNHHGQYLLLFHECKLFRSLELPCRRVSLCCTERLKLDSAFARQLGSTPSYPMS